jgi:hypothetical protein
MRAVWRGGGLHGRIVETIEWLYPELTEHLSGPHHAVRGEVWEKAVAIAGRSGPRFRVPRSARQ